MEATVSHELFARTIRRLLVLLIESRRDIEILNRLVAEGTPLPLSRFDKVRQIVTQETEPLMRSIEETPDDKLLEFLQHFEGTVQ